MLLYCVTFKNAAGTQKTCRVQRNSKSELQKELDEKGITPISIATYYPVASWEKNQHVFYNLMDRRANAYFETNSDEDYEAWQESQRLAGVFDCNPRVNGVVYVTYEDYKAMKDIIGGYAWRHNGRV